jgi:hypothetical protein
MTDSQALVKTLDFQLDIQRDNESLLYDATLEARSVYNETIHLGKEGVDWDMISDRVADDADLVKNTTQRVVAKALGAMENYYDERHIASSIVAFHESGSVFRPVTFIEWDPRPVTATGVDRCRANDLGIC